MDHSPGSSICGSHEYGMSWFLLLCSFVHQDLGLGLGNSVHCFDVTEPRRPWGVRLVHDGWPGFSYVDKDLVLDLEEENDHKILFSVAGNSMLVYRMKLDK